MPHAGQLTLKDIAWCAGVEAPRLRTWAASGRLKSEPPFSEYDALEAAVAFSLTHAGVSQKAATAAWDELRTDVRQLLLKQSTDIWIVVSADGPEAAALGGKDLVADAAARAGRCWVVKPDAVMTRARERFAAVQARLAPAAGVVRPMRSVRSTGYKTS